MSVLLLFLVLMCPLLFVVILYCFVRLSHKMDKINNRKRERSANFSIDERDMLISLIKAHKSVIENKESDASSWKKKDAAWANIEKEFNARIGGVFRSSKTLRVKYEGLKRLVRKKAARIRAELYRTGGGSNTAVPLDSVEEQIKDLISLTTDGLESVYDSDVLPFPSIQTQPSQDELNVATVEEFVVLPSTSTDTTMDLMENGSHDIKVLVEEKVVKDDDLNASYPTTLKAEETTVVNNSHLLDNSSDNTPSGKYVPTPSTTHKKWDVTSRNNLKSRRHPALVATRKPHFDELANCLNSTTQAKLELVQLQKSLLEAEITEKKKEWEFKDMERRWIEEEYKLRIEKLRRELKD